MSNESHKPVNDAEEIEETKRMLREVMRVMSKPITSEKRRKDVGPYEWDTGE